MPFKVLSLEHERPPMISFEFYIASDGDMSLLGRAFRTVVAADIARRPQEIAGLAVTGKTGSGKSTFVEAFLGMALAHDAGQSHDYPISHRHKTNPPSTMETFIDDLGTVIWFDAGWGFLNETKDDLVSSYRRDYLRLHPVNSQAGLNIVEHPENCQWDPDFHYDLDIAVEKELRAVVLAVEADLDDLPELEVFREQTRSLQFWPSF